MSIIYRVYEERDLKACLRLWSENAGWGELTEQQWREWYVDSPHGPAVVIVAEDDGEIIGQGCQMPVKVQVGAREVDALRLSAPIVHQRFRRMQLKRLDHPIVGLLSKGIEEATRLSYGLMYTLPARGWLKFFQWAAEVGVGNFRVAQFGCSELQFSESPTLDLRLMHACRPLNEFSAEHQELWTRACQSFPIACGVARTRSLLAYRNGGHLNLEVLNNTELIGFISIKKEGGLISDFLARTPEDTRDVFVSALHYLQTHGSELGNLSVLKSLDTPILRETLHAVGFRPVRFHFAFTCLTLDSTIEPEQVASDHWYLTGGD